jgi:hypothetical protein
LGKGNSSGGLRSQLKMDEERSGLLSQGLQEKEVSILPLLLFQFFGRQPSAIRERIIDGDIPQRICLL